MKYEEELESVRKSNGGTLRAADVVEYARSPDTALHSYFEWDDGKAAQEYRLEQARHLIRLVVRASPGTPAPARVYVSLVADRRADRGYRTLDRVMRSKKMRSALLAEAHADMERFEAKYQQLREMAGVIAEMRKAREAVAAPGPKRRALAGGTA